MSMAQRYAGFLGRVAKGAATQTKAEAIRQAAKKILDMEREQPEYFMAGVLCALDVVYLHDADPCSTLAVEIVDACGHDLVAFAKKDEYHNLDKLRQTDRAAARL